MKIIKYISIFFLGMVAFACTVDDAILIEDHFMDYEIPIVPVETNYVVGAHYSKFVWNKNVTEVPVIGKYDGDKGDPKVYAQHVTQAQKGGIDYFLLGLRSANNMTQFQSDFTYIDTLQMASNAAELKFAISYNFGSMGLADNKRIEDIGKVPVFLKDFEMMMPFFQKSNYMKIDGKCVVYMLNSHNLFANDNAALYQQLRSQMSGLGIELYLIGMQNEWTPPLRYDFRFVNGVNALTHSTYANISNTWYDRYIDFHKMCDQAWGYHKKTLAEYGVEYIPTISASINPKITNAASSNFIIEKNKDWFKANCNVARRVTGEKKLVLIDSFNDWNRDTQIEAATSYGEEYLILLKQEFKAN